MRAPLTPIEAGPTERPVTSRHCVEIDSEVEEKLPSLVGNEASTVREHDVAMFAKGPCKCDAKASGNMIIASPRGA